MKLRFLIVAATTLPLALLAQASYAGVAVGVTIPVSPAVPVYAPPPAAVVVAAPAVVVPPPPVIVAPLPVALPPVYVAPAYPAVTVRAGYWGRGVVVVR
ncbi:hypothetical protein [Paraburkholderia sp. BCC1885]|uniref:hypothetical protein n=1 Tax=Paraburkholderia sp. BCC1885 TaxID=2562669 RepID=UPI001183E5E8|nr:hypothetical protein [Paraburkholderia sp. BCC1885]